MIARSLRTTRRSALSLTAAALSAPILSSFAACTKRADVAIGSKDFTEELILGNIYALLLQHAALSVRPRLNLGGTQVAMAALQRGEIDLYPEYTGTALVTELKLPPIADPKRSYEIVKRSYLERFDLVWLDPAPMNDTQALATTQAISQRYHIRTLSELSAAAPMLRLGAIPEFTKREDGLPGLQKAYGGFNFKSVSLFDIGLKYKALLTGNVDVVVAFGTDGAIAADDLVVFTDDKHFWPAYQVAPVVRAPTLKRFPRIAAVLNGVAPLLTDATMRDLNELVDGAKRDPSDVAQEFLSRHRLA